MIWKCQCFINGPTQGWSEEVLHADAQTNPANVAGAYELILTKRAAMLGAPYQIVAYRISAYANDDGSRPAIRKKYFRRKLFPSTPNLGMPAEPGNVGVAIQFYDSTGQHSTRYVIGGPPDDAVTLGGQVNLAGAGFGAAASEFITSLTSTTGPAPFWGWGRVGEPVESRIASITNDATGRLVITCADPLGGLAVGESYPARISQVNKGKSTLNGPLMVTMTAGAVLTSHQAIAFLPPVIGGIVKVYAPLRIYTQYATGDVVMNTVKHRRGRPFGQGRGRSSVRPRA